jgi:hypothetical protein
MLQLTVPGERWEAEFFEDGTIEVERFVSTGRVEQGPTLLEDLVAKHSEEAFEEGLPGKS